MSPGCDRKLFQGIRAAGFGIVNPQKFPIQNQIERLNSLKFTLIWKQAGLQTKKRASSREPDARAPC
jgi:hypothetical protein